MTRLDWTPLTRLVHLTREQAIGDLEAHRGDAGGLTTRIKYTLHGYRAEVGVPRGARPDRYWKRWGGQELPLRVTEVIRQTDAGGWQVARDGEWVTVPGESFSRAMFEATMFDEISEAEALALTRQSALSADVPRFMIVEDQTNEVA